MIKLTKAERAAGYFSLQLPGLISEFKKIVVDHVHACLDAGSPEWTRCRALAEGRERWVEDEREALAGADVAATPEQVVSHSVQIASLPADQILKEYLRRGGEYFFVDVATLDDSPVLHIAGAGVYLWSPDHTKPPTLMCWLSFPAYPPAW
ncbi:MAG: hypothetical protein H6943_05065 [Zoogloeaceae bacterium]|nr:hypothetical protein [Zoogloeaceae bacterium]